MLKIFNQKNNRKTAITILFAFLFVLVLIFPKNAAAEMVVGISGRIILTIISWITYVILSLIAFLFSLAGSLFDWITLYTFNPNIYNINAIYNGWIVARDTANLFFIFILLTIAIATILRIETYGAKAILPKLIIAAFFINFSFLASQYVVFAANSLANIFKPEFSARGVSERFVDGLKPNLMFTSSNIDAAVIANEEEYKKQVERFGKLSSQKERSQNESTELESLRKSLSQQMNKQSDIVNFLIKDVIAMVGNIILLIFGTVVLGAAAILLLVRIPMIWFLMIMSPIAFLFFVLPGLKSHADKWWTTLLKQSFWPVAFFFLFSITLNMIADSEAEKLLSVKADTNMAYIGNTTLVLYYLLLMTMLWLCLDVARYMGAAGADATMKYATQARKFATGFAGGLATGTVGGWVARGAEGFSTEKSRGEMVKTLSRIPLVGGMMGGAAIRTLERAKQLGGLPGIRARQLEAAKLLSPRDRAEYISSLPLVSARENLIAALPENEVAKILNSATMPQQKQSIEDAVSRLSAQKQENIRYEQFKITPENKRAAFFNDQLKKPMQESFVKEKLSATDLASIYHTDAGKIRKTIGDALDQSSAERQQRFASEYGQIIIKLKPENMIEAFNSLTADLKGRIIDSYRKADIQKLAGAYGADKKAYDFVKLLDGIKPERIVEALSVLPLSAQAAGKFISDVAAKIDFAEISENEAITALPQIAYQITDKQIGDIVARGGEVLEAFVAELKNLGGDIKTISAKLRADGAPIASWVEKRGARELRLPAFPAITPPPPPPKRPSLGI